MAASSSSTSWYPQAWDARIAPIAAQVEHLRGLNFEHPVAVHFLPTKQFQDRVGDSTKPTSAAQRKEYDDQAAELRSLGWLGGKVDLAKAFETEQRSGIAAYYDPDAKEIYVSGTNLDVEHRVTLAHELTHVLQDQHFDLNALRRRVSAAPNGSSDALRGLIEGDAMRIEDQYVKGLSAADQRTYGRQHDAATSRAQAANTAPAVVDALFSAPYTFGPATVEVLAANGGNGAVDAALRHAIVSNRTFVQPGVLDDDTVVPVPVLPTGAVKLHDETVEAFDVYLMLAPRTGATRALLAADGVGGGRGLVYHDHHGVLCTSATLAATSDHAGVVLVGALRDWAASVPAATVSAAGTTVRFRSCDPGTRAVAPASARFDDAVKVLELRDEIAVSAAQSGAPAGLARCAARVFMQNPQAEHLLVGLSGEPTPDEAARLRAAATDAGAQCRDDPNAGLP